MSSLRASKILRWVSVLFAFVFGGQAGFGVGSENAQLLMVDGEGGNGMSRLNTIKPFGVFSDFIGGGDSLAHPEAKGGLVRVTWAQLEPINDDYDWQPILDQIERMDVHSSGKPWSLAVAAGKESPSWLYDEGVASFMVTSGRDGDVVIPKFWDESLQAHLADFATALAEQFGNDERLVLIYLPQMTVTGVEGHFNQVPFETLEAAGLTADLWIDAVKEAATSFAMAFSEKPIAVELHNILGLSEIPISIMNELWGDPSLQHRVGVAMWWISGDDSGYQADLLAAMEKYPGDIYAQVIGRSDQVDRFPNGYAAAFEQARRLGVRYIEPWDYEFVNFTSDNLFEDYNKWSKINCQ